MLWFIFCLFSLTFALIGVLALADMIPRNYKTDWKTPMNLFLFKEPRPSYSDQIVNVWIPKPFRQDGKRIPCRIERVPESDHLIIYSHGNAEDLQMCAQFIRELSSSLNVNVLAYDYSGYGLNEPESWERSEEGLNATLKAVIQYATETLQFSMTKIVLYGYSLGSGPSTWNAKENPVGGLIIQGGYRSINAVIEENYGSKMSQIFPNRWVNEEHIKSVHCPILILHGQSDGLISYNHANVLANNATATQLKRKVIFPNVGHTKYIWSDVVNECRKWWMDAIKT